MDEYILQLTNITKYFPGVTALKDVNFDLKPGEVHALVGENGAGKSTLVKIITGVLQPSEGTILYEGEEVQWDGTLDSVRKGIAAIYQEPAIFPDLNVAENIFMGHQPKYNFPGNIQWKKMYRKTEDLFKTLNSNIKPKDKIIGLSNAERQLVEIAKALSVQAKVVIMDEPTSALSISESEELFRIIEDLKNQGTAIIFISHRIEDIFIVADRVTALRDGILVGTRKIDEVDMNDLIHMMVGREVSDLYPKLEVPQGEEILRVEGLSKLGDFRDVSFKLHKGEILGLYGLIGAGRTEVAKAVFGLTPPDSGEIFIRGSKALITSPEDAIKAGVAYVPEDRDEEGTILNMNIVENITLPILDECREKLFLNGEKEKEITEAYANKLEVKAASIFSRVLSLSGGNKQKVVLAKWLASNATIILLDEPTKGIDVGAKAAVHQLISELAKEGYGILMISSELPEILGMSDRVLVMHEGHVKAEFQRNEADQKNILASALAGK